MKKSTVYNLKHGKKMSYKDRKRFLPPHHPYRKEKNASNGERGLKTTMIPLTSEEILKKIKG